MLHHRFPLVLQLALSLLSHHGCTAFPDCGPRRELVAAHDAINCAPKQAWVYVRESAEIFGRKCLRIRAVGLAVKHCEALDHDFHGGAHWETSARKSFASSALDFR